MRRPWRSLRVQLAIIGFAAMYVPVLALLGVTEATERTVVVNGVEITEGVSTERSPWVAWTVIALAPATAAAGWLLAGRAVRPIDRIRSVADDIQASDLSRRIALDGGPTEVVALASSFDAMLDRLDLAAETQRRLVEEASHELRTPLAVLATNADVLLAHPDPSVELYRQGLERSKAAADRLRSTVEELLVDARGRARTIQRRPVDVAALARQVVDDAHVVSAARGVAVEVVGVAEAPCAVDAPTVRRALGNLVENATAAAPAGSTVTVEVALDDVTVALVVTDHGEGVPPEWQQRIFERFWSDRPHTGGTGLGLPIARQVALAHGGDLTVTSPGPSGDGSVFTLRLRR